MGMGVARVDSGVATVGTWVAIVGTCAATVGTGVAIIGTSVAGATYHSVTLRPPAGAEVCTVFGKH